MISASEAISYDTPINNYKHIYLTKRRKSLKI